MHSNWKCTVLLCTLSGRHRRRSAGFKPDHNQNPTRSLTPSVVIGLNLIRDRVEIQIRLDRSWIVAGLWSDFGRFIVEFRPRFCRNQNLIAIGLEIGPIVAKIWPDHDRDWARF